MRNFLFAFAALAACSSQPTTDNSDQLDAPAGKADGSVWPVGTFTNATPHVGEFNTLTLNDDYTYSRYELGACPGGGTCAPALQTGTYLFTHGSTHHYIRFYDEDGNFVDRYAWQLDADGSLELDRNASDYWYALAPQASQPTQANQCSVDTDCSGILPDFCRVCGDGTESCAHWSCVANGCAIVTCQ